VTPMSDIRNIAINGLIGRFIIRGSIYAFAPTNWRATSAMCGAERP
jgi:hypothetical protein